MKTMEKATPPRQSVPTERAALLLHGFFGLPFMMSAISKDLRAHGVAVATPFYPSWRWPLARISAHISAYVARSPQLRDADRLDIVAHSMGGLVARMLIAHHRPDNLGRVVCLGTPHGGSAIADRVGALPLARNIVLGAAAPALITNRAAEFDALLGAIDYPLGNIAGTSSRWEGPTARFLPQPNDGKVSVSATHCAGEADHIALPVPHRMLPFDRTTRLQVLAFLAHGRFDHPQPAHSIVSREAVLCDAID